LAARGWHEGKNLAIEYRWAAGEYERFPQLVAELVRMKVDLIATVGTPATQAAMNGSATIPIVMIAVGDPVGTRLVASLARPGGNVTGTSMISPPIVVKRLELLKEALPALTRVVLLINPRNPAQALSLRAVEQAGRVLKVEVRGLEARSVADIRGIFAALARQPADAVVVPNDNLLNANARLIVELAARQRMPCAGSKEFAEAGGLVGYGSSVEVYRYSAIYVDKILNGARPADLPVEQPARFEVAINLKAAAALGIEIPAALKMRADQVIE
jgi:putative ABC transport system substrate-binding protein